MKTKKHLKISLVSSMLMSLILYGAILFQSISILEFQYAQMLLFSAQTFVMLTIIFIICFVAISKNILSITKIKKIIVSSVSVCLSICAVVMGYGWLSCYNCYTPENIIENDKVFVQQFIPYHDIFDNKRENTELLVSHIPGTDYISLNCYGISDFGTPFDYKVEYFKSASVFMNMKFRLEKCLSSYFSVYDIDVVALGKEMEIGGTKLTVYVEDNDYAIFIKSFGQTIYASLINVPDDISAEDFAKEVIRQFELLDQATKEKVFLDVKLF